MAKKIGRETDIGNKKMEGDRYWQQKIGRETDIGNKKLGGRPDIGNWVKEGGARTTT